MARAAVTSALRGNGRGDVIRTHDPLHPMQVRYQAALRPDTRWSIPPSSVRAEKGPNFLDLLPNLGGGQ